MTGANSVPCSQVLSAMWAYVDGEPASVDRDAMAGHLQRCPSCNTESQVEALFKLVLARSLQVEAAPERVRARVWAQITRIEVQITRTEVQIRPPSE